MSKYGKVLTLVNQERVYRYLLYYFNFSVYLKCKLKVGKTLKSHLETVTKGHRERPVVALLRPLHGWSPAASSPARPLLLRPGSSSGSGGKPERRRALLATGLLAWERFPNSLQFALLTLQPQSCPFTAMTLTLFQVQTTRMKALR